MTRLAAKRYARGLYRSIDGDLNLAKKHSEVLAALSELYQDEQISKVLRSPVMPQEIKLDVLKVALKQVEHDDKIVDFLRTVTAAGRLKELPEISNEFKELILKA